jgi:hypothetical protein
MPKVYRITSLATSMALSTVIIAGCGYDAPPDSSKAATQPSDAALRDPYGKWTGVNTNVSGGGREGMKHDIDNFLLK